MTAKELVNKYTKLEVTVLGCGKDEGNPCVISGNMLQKDAKQCALIAVDEMKTYLDIWINSLASEPEMDKMKSDWQALGDEIEKL